MLRDDPSPKIGAGHAEAMFRTGLRELRAALYPESNIAQQPDYGLAGMATPGEVAESRREVSEYEMQRYEDDGGRAISERLKEAESRSEDPGREDKGMEKE